MKDKPCKFCDELGTWQMMQRKRRKEGSPVRDVYEVALVVRSKVDGQKGTRGRITGKGHPLAYCPECGRRLKRTWGAGKPAGRDPEHYEKELKRIVMLPNCNDCGLNGLCAYAPKLGDTVRFNCPLWQRMEAANNGD